MITAGIDVGAATTKALILNENSILSCFISPTKGDVVKASDEVMEAALTIAGLDLKRINRVVSTGYGRNSVSFSNKSITEIACHAKGAGFLFKEAKMVIDIGGQDSKAILLGHGGKVEEFVMNDKCAAGTGRFLEVMAGVLDLELETLGKISLKSRTPCQISSICTVFAESEVVSLRAEKKAAEDIISGIHQSIAKRMKSMATPMGFAQPIVFTGGVAKNVGVIRALEVELKTILIIPDEPQMVGALGAALFAGTES
jgi:predicted CoA-substrate-specific enzyme activase